MRIRIENVLGRHDRGTDGGDWIGGDQRGETPPFSSQSSHRHCFVIGGDRLFKTLTLEELDVRIRRITRAASSGDSRNVRETLFGVV